MSGRVLVTGGAGFIGSHIAEAYLAAGWEVVVLDDLSRGHQRNVPSGARFVRADIRSPEARKLLAEGGFTVLNHHAAQIDVRVSVDEPALDASINVVGLANLLEGAGAGGVKRVVFASSGGVVYGDPEVVPTPETAPKAPIIEAFTNSWRDMIRVVCAALMNVIPVVATVFGAAYAVQPDYGIGFQKDIYLWIPVLGNILAVAVIPFVGNLSDKVGRKPPIVIGALGAGLLSFGYLYAISIHNVPLAIGMSLLMWGLVYQGYNAVFPSFYPELFPTRTRCSAMAISQIGRASCRERVL